MSAVDKTYIFANKNKNAYFPEHIFKDMDEELYRLEYGDVKEGEYQVWEYPSGKIFSIVPDREVPEKQYYAVPSPDLWLPKLVIKEENPTKVAEAFGHLTTTPKKKSFWKRLFKT